jgi:hypothetical protein
MRCIVLKRAGKEAHFLVCPHTKLKICVLLCFAYCYPSPKWRAKRDFGGKRRTIMWLAQRPIHQQTPVKMFHPEMRSLLP